MVYAKPASIGICLASVYICVCAYPVFVCVQCVCVCVCRWSQCKQSTFAWAQSSSNYATPEHSIMHVLVFPTEKEVLFDSSTREHSYLIQYIHQMSKLFHWPHLRDIPCRFPPCSTDFLSYWLQV